MFQLTCPGKQCVKNDVLSGLTVALALVPEAVAFAFVAGASSHCLGFMVPLLWA